MRKLLFVSTAMLGLAVSAAAFAQTTGEHWAHQPGTGESGPASMRASNIDQGDSHSDIAPHFPAPQAGADASPEAYLRNARHALTMKQTGEAQQALEMAESRLLDRSTEVSMAGQPAQSPEIMQLNQARAALGHGDTRAAIAAIDMALSRAPRADVMPERTPVAALAPYLAPGIPVTSIGAK